MRLGEWLLLAVKRERGLFFRWERQIGKPYSRNPAFSG